MTPVYLLHLNSLRRFEERTAAYKLLGKIGVDLLDVARMHTGVDLLMAAVTIDSFTDDVFDDVIREYEDEAREAQEGGEIDAAWARISHDVLPTRMTLEEILKAGEVDSPSKVKYAEKFGGGFMVSLEATHQMHCLNLLRKASWIEYYEPVEPSFQDAPYIVRMHLDHCIEMIRQNIMCNAEVMIITWDWVERHKTPYPNFNTRHQCRNYEKILEWAGKHAVHIDKSDVTRLEDTVELPSAFHHA
ncbi:hypothetical protein DFH29DRAFT_1002457 [Suillus ampliporus]|nr:hypothetical protein DFH29DRAFT_1002457 [Suillus ampliporus]